MANGIPREEFNPTRPESYLGYDPELFVFIMEAAEELHTRVLAKHPTWAQPAHTQWLHPDAATPLHHWLRSKAEHIYRYGHLGQPVAYAIQLAETILNRQAPINPNRDTPYTPRTEQTDKRIN